jgi:DsbC/DsbD-like thiol-disulfide interchange protein
VLHRFGEAQKITFPMLSDKGSVVIRKFGIVNTNVPSDVTRFYGMPFPGQYLLAPDGTVREKLFLPDYQTRPASSELVLRDFGSAAAGNSVTVTAGDVRARITLSDGRTYGGQQLGVAVDFNVAKGWHIYGRPLPEGYVPTSIVFDDTLLRNQSMQFPKPTPVKFEVLGETLPVYQGEFKAVGTVLLKRVDPGEYKLGGTLEFQECNDEMCKMPEKMRFEIPLKVEAMVPPAAAK